MSIGYGRQDTYGAANNNKPFSGRTQTVKSIGKKRTSAH
jgi:hypothetical protein